MNTQVMAKATETWLIDPEHTEVEFSVKHLMIATVKGRFKDVKGSVALDLENRDRALVDVVIAAASIDTGTEQRDAHLRSSDFFDVENHPHMLYRAQRVERIDERRFKLHGQLTIRGTTRQVSLDVEELGRARDPYGATRAMYVAQTVIDRKDFGLTWNVALEAGGVMVGDQIKVAINVQLISAANDADV